LNWVEKKIVLLARFFSLLHKRSDAFATKECFSSGFQFRFPVERLIPINLFQSVIICPAKYRYDDVHVQ
jgi:hypothetical protein